MLNIKKCKICGDTKDDTRIYNHKEEGVLCRKHYIQYNRHGEYFDRTIYDGNEINIEDDIAKIHMYDKNGDETGITIIDKEDVDKIKGYKIYLDDKGYSRVSLKNGGKVFLHNFITDIEGYVDHENQNKLDNRKSNLREVDHQKNAYNVDKGLYKGVKEPRKGSFTAAIHHNYNTYHLGTYYKRKFALYARYLAEMVFCPEYRDKNYDKEKEIIFETITKLDKNEIRDNVNEQITKLKKRYDS